MYLDPGFGGMLVQLIVAIVAVGGAIIFSMRKKIKNLFTKNKSNNTTYTASTIETTDDEAIDVLATPPSDDGAL